MPASAWFATQSDHLTEARANFQARAMVDRCRIEAWSHVKNPRGTVVKRFERTRADKVPCRLAAVAVQVAGVDNGGIYGRSGQLIDTLADQWTLEVPFGTPLAQDDQVVLADGQRYQVQDVREQGSELLAVTARLVRVGLDQAQAGQGDA